MSGPRRAVFMDRDGTLSPEVGYVNHVSRFSLFPWTVEAIRALNRSGLCAVVVTNQAGVARGYFPESVIHEVHAALQAALAAGGAHLDGLYFCAHHPTVGEPPYRCDCDCRKPKPGLLTRAATDLGLDLAGSFVVGDRYGDMELAWSVGARGVMVRSGYGLGELTHLAPAWKRRPDLVAEHLLEAVQRILDVVEAESR
jgi:D-glycero-D-manno-heptose 1,7-bisphosphate phosphatase